MIVWLSLFSEPSIVNINTLGRFGVQDPQPTLPHSFSDFVLPVNFASSVFFLVICVFLSKNIQQLRLNVSLFIFCFLCGFTFVTAESYHFYDSSKLVTSSSLHFCFALIRALGYAVLCYVFCSIVDSFFKKNIRSYLDSVHVFNTRIFVSSLLILWSPFVVLNFPGSGAWDFYVMVSQWAGDLQWTSHHPIYVTIFYGICMDVGKFLGDSGFGLMLIVCFNIIICAIASTMLAKLVYDFIPSKVIFSILILYFGLLPIYPAYIQLAYKDTISMAFTTILTVQIARFIQKDGVVSRGYLVAFFIVVLGVILARNTGIYLVVPSLLGLVFYYWKAVRVRYNLLALLISALVVSKALLLSAAGYWGISQGSYGEILSLPFQQTARYLKEYPNDLTEKEFYALNKVLVVEKFAIAYNPSLSDPLKGLMKSQDKEDIENYLLAWWSMFLRHPSVYISAMINHTYDYFFFDGMSKVYGVELPTYKLGVSVEGPNFGTYDYEFLFNDQVRSFINNYYSRELWRRIPIVGLLYHAGVYSVMLLLALFYALRKKNFRLTLMFMPAIMSLLFCLASPVNGSVRYILPLFSLFPFYMAVCISDRYELGRGEE